MITTQVDFKLEFFQGVFSVPNEFSLKRLRDQRDVIYECPLQDYKKVLFHSTQNLEKKEKRAFAFC